MTAIKTVRCAIYTRKSSEEGLDQSFNSLHAQREACEAYILSQKHEGWQVLSTDYDDGGFSGGNMVRPGLTKLLADITAGRVDTVVVYKVDRLTRSLADFAKIVESFDGKGVSFVSVTQQFNTTSSMGRLTLNVLLSFAQFEREVTGERIRDKVAASKKKGMWMGGHVALGYDLVNHELIVNEAEAVVVRQVFARYLQLGNVRTLYDDLAATGVRSKEWISSTGRRFGGTIMSRGSLYHTLNNPVYIGKTKHKDLIHEGKHAAIVDLQLWEQVQDLLKMNGVTRRRSRNVPSGRLLQGKLRTADGRPYTATHAAKGGRRYFYYTLTGKEIEAADATVKRLPAVELEECVVAAMSLLLADPLQVTAQFPNSTIREMKLLTSAATARANLLRDGDSRQSGLLMSKVVNSVTLHADLLSIELDAASLGRELLDRSEVSDELAGTIVLQAPFTVARRGSEVRLILSSGTNSTPEPTQSLVRAMTQARTWSEWIIRGEVTNLKGLADRVGFSRQYTSQVMRLAALSPEIEKRILMGAHSSKLNLIELTRHLPFEWDRQSIPG